MKVELKHHYGWKSYDIEANSLEDAAYKAILNSHTFLTPENHTYTAHAQPEWEEDSGYIRIIRTQDADRHPMTPWWYDTKAGSIWMDVVYRAEN